MEKEFKELLADHMTRSALLNCCRYYNGEDESPFSDHERSMFWNYERYWFRMMTGDKAAGELCDSFMLDYDVNGLSSFEADDIAPKSLKALLYNRFSHWSQEPADAFRAWYISVYCRR